MWKMNNKLKQKYQEIKKEFWEGSFLVTGVKSESIDINVLNFSKNVQLVKLVVPNQMHLVETWKDKLETRCKLNWYKCDYIVIYLNDDYEEINRITHTIGSV